MMKLQSILCLCLSSTVWTLDFKAAVLEYHPQFYKGRITPDVRLENNIAEYKKYASEKPDAYDIFVYPATTLYIGAIIRNVSGILPYSTVVPEPKSEIVVCDQTDDTYAPFFRELSCLAKTLNKFLAVNLAEKVSCKGSKDCPSEGYKAYNTNVILNREGKVVARYRKYNLFGEIYMAKPELEIVTFHLKPNIKVGLFTSFDLIFKKPALDLVRKEKPQVIVFPVVWNSELPFLTALQSQQQWARELNVILLAAGANDPKYGSSGSAIYLGKEGYNKGIITSKYESKVLYEDINSTQINRNMIDKSADNIDKEAKEMDSFYLMKEKINNYSSKLLHPAGGTDQVQVCNGQLPNRLCCDFTVETTINEKILNDNNNHYQYHLVAFSGVRSFSGVATAGIESCAVIACLNEDIDSCSTRFKDYNTISWPFNFTKIEVKARFVKDENRIQFPNSLRSNIQPLPATASNWETKEVENSIERKHTLIQSEGRLLTFGIFGRDFNRDGEVVTPMLNKLK